MALFVLETFVYVATFYLAVRLGNGRITLRFKVFDVLDLFACVQDEVLVVIIGKFDGANTKLGDR